MQVLFDGELPVHYGFFFLMSGDDLPDLATSCSGQANGLCGAAHPGSLAFVTGLHTGPLPLRVEAHPAEPGLAEDWDDVVEVPLRTTTAHLVLQAFQDQAPVRLPAPGDYRVRYCGAGIDEGAAADTRSPGSPPVDRYLVQLWPAAPAPDAVVRQGSARAAYWHRDARDAPLPPSAKELAVARAAEDELRRAEEQAARAYWDLFDWGGRLPSDALRATGGRAHQLARWDHDLAEHLVALGPEAQRALAVHAARWAWARAGRTGDPEVAAALDALERGRPLPPPFHDVDAAWDWAFPGPKTATSAASYGALTRPLIDPAAAAVDALLCAADPDPAVAATGAVDAAASGTPDHAALVAEVRRLML